MALPVILILIVAQEYLNSIFVFHHSLESLSPIASGPETKYVFSSWSDSGSQTHSYTVPSSSATVTAVYDTYYNVGYTANVGVSVPVDEWVKSGGVASGVFSSPVVLGDTRYVFVSDDRPGTINNATTVTATYDTYHRITIDASSNVKVDTSDFIVHFGGSDNTGDILPFTTGWIKHGTSFFYEFYTPVASSSSPSSSKYVWVSTTGLNQTLQSNTFNVTASGTINGTYSTQYQVTFGQSGVGSDFTGTVVTVDSVNYGRAGVSLWLFAGVHSFAFQSPLVVTANVKQYVWSSTSGLSSTQTESITVSGSGSVTAAYETMSIVQVTISISSQGQKVTATITFPSGVTVSSWNYNSGTSQLTMTINGVTYVFNLNTFKLTLTYGANTGDVFPNPSGTVNYNSGAKQLTIEYAKSAYVGVLNVWGVPKDAFYGVAVSAASASSSVPGTSIGLVGSVTMQRSTPNGI